jgi:hypothetical protein
MCRWLAPRKEGSGMATRTLYLPVMVAAAVLVACVVALLAVSEQTEATFPGKNGKIAFMSFRHGNIESTYSLYTMNPNGQALERLTNNHAADFDPDWQPLSPPDNRPFKVKGSA